MRSSNAGEGNSHWSVTNAIASPPPSSVLPQTNMRKTMEEVWKDINLSTLGHDSRSSTPSFSSVEAPGFHYKNSAAAATAASAAGRQSFGGMILQDFLATSFRNSHSSADGADHPQAALPPTGLSLCTSGFWPQGFCPGQSTSNSDSSCPVHVATGTTDAFFPSNKRFLDATSCVPGADRRHKRMIKNRESASRSRARKQARTPTSSVFPSPLFCRY